MNSELMQGTSGSSNNIHIPATESSNELIANDNIVADNDSDSSSDSDVVIVQQLPESQIISELTGNENSTSDNLCKTDAIPEESNVEISYDVNVSALAPEKLMVVPVTLSALTVDALIDSGATVSLIRRNMIKDDSLLHPVKMNRTIVGLGHSPVVPLYSVNIELGISSVVLSCSCLVVPDDAIGYSVILGDNFFLQNGLKVKNGQISGSLAGGSWTVYLGDDNSPYVVYQDIPVYSAEDVMLEDNDPILVKVNVQGVNQPADGHEFYYDGLVDTNCSTSIVCTRGILQVQQGMSSVLVERLPNKLMRPKLVKAGTLLGCVSTLVDFHVNASAAAVSPPWSEESILNEIGLNELSADEHQSVLAMLKSRSAAFSRGDEDIGCAGVTQHKIELTDSTPIRQKPRRFPEPVVKEIERQCDELKQLDIIEYSKSPWSSPVVPVKKKDGSLRLCIDYRQLNKVTRADRFPMPNMTDLVFGLHGTRYFTTLDLVKGYYQVPLHPDSVDCTAFSTTRNHYQFKRLPFGLRNAPMAFQREMQTVLHDFNTKQVVVYIDDILIMSKSFSEHVDLVGKVLATLINYGMKIKLNKCCWFKGEVDFLGHVVGCDGVKKSPKYVKEVQQFPKPGTVKQLRSFLGLVNFQRKFIPQCSVICKPLSKLLGSSDKALILWSDEMNQSFEELKTCMAKDIILIYPDYSATAHKMELSTDASRYGSGACLTQLQGDSVRVIGYASMTFSKAQVNYSTIEQELAAIRWAVRVFRCFLYGVPFVLYTDHKPLVYMSNMAQHNSRIVRTMNELAEYDFEIRFRAGKDNIIADTLSRIPQNSAPVDAGYSPASLPSGLNVIRQIEGGGDSMVKSLLEVLEYHRGQYDPGMKVPSSDIELRQEIVTELMQNPEIYDIKLDKVTKNKLKMAKFPGQLPSDLFFLAFNNLFNLQVWVHHGIGRPVMFLLTGQSVASEASHRVHLQCVSGVHFDPLVENRLYDAVNVDEPENITTVENVCDIPVDDECEEPTVDLELMLARLQALTSVCECQAGTCTTCTTVQIGDGMYCALIDTGAQISLISDYVWNQLSVEEQADANFQSVPVKIRSLGSASPVAKGIISLKWKLAGHNIEWKTPVAIMSKSDMPYCMVIGMNVIKHLNLEIDYISRQFQFISAGEMVSCSFRPVDRCDMNTTEFCLTQRDISILHQENNEIDSSSESSVDEESKKTHQALLSSEQIKQTQQQNYVVRQLYNKIRKVVDPTLWKLKSLMPFKRYSSKMSVSDGILWVDTTFGSVPVVPFNVLVEVASQLHQQMSHLGRNKLLKAVQECVWHPSLHDVVSDVCSTCFHCQCFKVSTQVIKPPMLKIQAAFPFELIAADLVQLPKTRHGYIGCLVVIDHFTKWLSVVPIRNKTALTVASALERLVLPNLPRKPERILTDNGREFTSEQFNDLLDQYNIRHIYSTPYKPSSNGAVERANRTLIEMLRCLSSDPAAWDDSLAKAVVVYNHSWHSSIGMSPSQCIMTKSHSHIPGALVDKPTVNTWRDGHPSFVSFSVDDLVLKKVQMTGNLVTNKFGARYNGPYKVVTVRNNGITYEVTRVDDDEQVLRVHHTQLKKLNQPPKYLQSLVDGQGFDLIGESKNLYSIEGLLDSAQVECSDSSLVLTSDEAGVYSTADDSEMDSTDFDAKRDFSGFEVTRCTLSKKVPICNTESCTSDVTEFAHDKSCNDGPMHSTPLNDGHPNISVSHVSAIGVNESPLMHERSCVLSVVDKYILNEQDAFLGSAIELLLSQEEALECIEKSLPNLACVEDKITGGLSTCHLPNQLSNCVVSEAPIACTEGEAPLNLKENGEPTKDKLDFNELFADTREVGLGFSGFASPNLQGKGNIMSFIHHRRLSLTPIKNSIKEARSLIEENRRRSRARILTKYRVFANLPSSESNLPMDINIPSVSRIVPYHTRSHGKVPD